MAVRRCLLVLLLLVSGCSLIRQPSITKIALLAPFEGRYREIGYDALYAARLAIADSSSEWIDLLATDDGGSVASAVDRARAIQHDPAIALTLILGPYASDAAVQRAFGSHPVLIIGHWNARPTGASAFILASRDIDSLLSVAQPENVTTIRQLETPFVGSELLALKQVPLLRDNLEGIIIVSSASLPDDDFARQYRESDSFAPQPGLLASLTYDATMLSIRAITNETPLREMRYEGMNGLIVFDADGYWLNAPIHEFVYENGQLVGA